MMIFGLLCKVILVGFELRDKIDKILKICKEFLQNSVVKGLSKD